MTVSLMKHFHLSGRGTSASASAAVTATGTTVTKNTNISDTHQTLKKNSALSFVPRKKKKTTRNSTTAAKLAAPAEEEVVTMATSPTSTATLTLTRKLSSKTLESSITDSFDDDDDTAIVEEDNLNVSSNTAATADQQRQDWLFWSFNSVHNDNVSRDGSDDTVGSSSSSPSYYSALAASVTTQAEQLQVNKILNCLSTDELELAARCNFHYLKAATSATQGIKQQQRLFASEMAIRYLRSKRSVDRALNAMKTTFVFRKQINVDGLRLAFGGSDSNKNIHHDESNSDGGDSHISEDEYNNHHTQMLNDAEKAKLRNVLDSGCCYVQGYDREGRATYIFEPYKVKGHDAEWTIKQHVFTLEKAIACTKAPDQTVNAVIHFSKEFSAFQHSPPFDIGKQFMQTLRLHYAGHVHRIFMIDAPTAFMCLWKVFKPMLSNKTTDKITFVSSLSGSGSGSLEEKHAVLRQYYDPEQAAPWMLPPLTTSTSPSSSSSQVCRGGGGGKKTRKLDLNEYLFQTPFDCAFDE